MKKQKELLIDTILYYNSVAINEFEYGKGITANFLEYAANKYKLTIEKEPENKVIKLYYQGEEIAKMSGLRPSSTSDVAYKLCKDKFKLENHLKNMSLNTLESEHFFKNEYNDAINYIQRNDFGSYVIKPLNLAGGRGIQLEVNIDNFKTAWDKCIKEQEDGNIKNPSCIVQPFINGFDIRVTVIEGKYSGALLRVPAHVIGNGQNSIKELIKEKNKLRATISYFKNKLIPTDNSIIEYLNNENLNLDTVPGNNKVVLLTKMSNLTFGGESIDITNILSKEIKSLAIKAAASVPGLYSTGIDIMTQDYKNGIGHIIEMNTSANLTMHHLPLKGEKSFPYYTFVRANLIKYKVLNGIRLTISEEEFWSEVQKFLLLKDYYANKYFKL